jgi:P27 family predicted phage terminase small subunit
LALPLRLPCWSDTRDVFEIGVSRCEGILKGRKPKLWVVDESFRAPRRAKRCPPAPAWFTSQAIAEWHRAAPELLGRGLLSSDVMASLESYCLAVGTVRELEEIMGREGRLVDTDDGPKPHPAFRMQSAAMREARLLASELGLTPHRRPGKRNDAAPGGDRWEGLLG